MKNLLLLLVLMFAENGWSCSLVGDGPSKSISSELVIGSDTVVWVEYLSHVKSETQKPDDMSQELFDVQGTIAGCSIKNSHTYSFNELETLKGSLKSLSFKFTDQNLFPRFAASNLIEGSKYILVINDGSIKAVIEAGSDKVYSSLKEIVNKAIFSMQ